jgi:hypothetical protein
MAGEKEGGVSYPMVIVLYPGAPIPMLIEREVPDAEDRWQAALQELLDAGEEETEG